jgi:hypothetical protein
MILIPKIQTIVPCEKQDGKIKKKKKKKQEKKVEYTFQASKNDVELQMR